MKNNLSKLIVFWKTFQIILTTVFLYVLFVGFRWILPSIQKQKYRRIVVKTWGRILLKIIGVTLEVKGYVPRKSPKITVSNHLGYLDILVYCAIYGCTFISKSEVGTWPVIGKILKVVDIILIDRTSARNSAKIADHIFTHYDTHKNTVVFFPEGTSSGGKNVLPFKALLFQTIIDRNLPVTYAAISYTVPKGHDASEEVCWWRPETTLVGHVENLLKIKHIKANVTIGEETLKAADRRSLSELAHSKVVSIFKKTG